MYRVRVTTRSRPTQSTYFIGLSNDPGYCDTYLAMIHEIKRAIGSAIENNMVRLSEHNFALRYP